MERLQLPRELMQILSTAGGQNLLSMTVREREQLIADAANKELGTLEGYDCPECLNRGYFSRVDENGYRYSEECKCMTIRRNKQRIKRSGMEDMVARYTFSAWREQEKWQTVAREMAEQYAQEKTGWFLVSGPPGTGKTHLCTALCGLLMDQGVDTRYMLWRDVSVKAKAVVNDEEAYQDLIGPLKHVRCLYIDDFIKTGKGQEPTTGDVNLAFELLNSRYNDSKKLTIISTEREVEQLLNIDEAVGSRIYERSRGRYLSLAGKKNWRLKE